NERFAEAFALAFLMPATSVRQRFQDVVTSTNDFQVADLRRLSHLYFVSVEAMALRLEQLGLITKGSWQFLKESKFAPKQAADLLGLRPQPINDQPFPERYLYLAVSAYERGEIGDSDLAYYLRCDIVSAREMLAKTLTSREVVDATGEQRDVRLDFQKSLLTEAS
ncbi:MAG: ImmA/IrrE family metallo-endopeptidase, partial [Pirellulales bacterium]